MAAQDWDVLTRIGMHTLVNGAAILSWVVLNALITQFVDDDILRVIIKLIEGGVLVVLVLVFARNLIYDVVPEKIREIIASKFVFA